MFTKMEASTNLLGNRENRLSMWAIQAAPVVRATRALPPMDRVRVTKTRMAKGVPRALSRAGPGRSYESSRERRQSRWERRQSRCELAQQPWRKHARQPRRKHFRQSR